jgi:uncharacterized protein (TIGR03437 family)
MQRTSAVLTLAFLACVEAHAATTTTTVTVNNASVSLTGATGGSVAGTATFSPGIPDTTGPFAATVSLGTAVSGPFTIKLAGGTLGGTVSLPATILSSTSPVSGGSLVISGTTSTGTYAGASGTIALTGTGSIGASGFAVSFSGTGAITTSGSTGGGGGTGPTAPVITDVLDAGSNTPNLAQGGFYIVKGSNLCPKGVNIFNVPRPTVAADGVKVTFTPNSGGSGTDAILYYEYNPTGSSCQLSGILPSTVAAGNYNVVVTNGTASAPFATKVSKSKFSLFTQDSTGTGLASAQNVISATRVDLNSFTSGNGKATTISPAYPGQYMQVYGTGMGPLASGDNAASPIFDFSTNGTVVKAIVGGISTPVLFAGRAGYAGEDQITFQLPTNVPTGCAVSFQISVDGALSNSTFIAIAPDSTSGVCVMPGFTASQLQKLDQGGTFTVGGFNLLSITETVPQLGTVTLGETAGAFSQYTAYQLAGAGDATSLFNPNGACYVTQTTSSTTTTTSGGRTILDAGAITLTGPAGSNITNLALKQDAGLEYSATISGIPGLPGGSGGSIIAGTYTLNGAGGKDVGKFSASVTLGAPLTVTGGLPASVNRGAGLTLNWTGGKATDIVEIVGSSTPTTTSGTKTFTCITTAGQRTFTVPSSILTQLDPTGSTGAGSLLVISAVNPTSGNGIFSAPLVAGGNIDAGFFFGLSGVGGTPTYN